MSDQRYLTACHEAGHAVAALHRGGGELVSITIDPDIATGRAGMPALGHTHTRCRTWDNAFITYAGPWAEARAQWNEASLDAEDFDGCIFDDYVLGAFLCNVDGDRYEPDEWQGSATEQVWGMELERWWPIIQRVAALLMDGMDDVDVIYALVHGGES